MYQLLQFPSMIYNFMSFGDRRNRMKQQKTSYKKLYRSSKNSMIAGVCGGIAEYLDCDPTWIRLVFVLFLLFGGSAVLVYVLLWLIVPLDENTL